MFPMIAGGQINLVPNPSLEDTFRCPSDSNVIKTKKWFNPTNYGTPDFFYVANQGNSICLDQAPAHWGGGGYNNAWGNQTPHSGLAYAGMAVSQGSELMESPLSDSMIAGKKYAVSFYVSVGDLWGSGLDLIGVSFLPDSTVDYTGAGTLPATLTNDAGNQSGNIITDTLGWSLVADTFVANGGEKYFILGNIDVANTQYYNSPNPTAVYFYFDDFDIHCVDCSTSVPVIPDYPEISLTPNPSNGEFILKGNFPLGSKIEFYNLLGQRLSEIEIAEGNQSLPISLQLAQGVYFYEITTGEKKMKSGKIVIAK